MARLTLITTLSLLIVVVLIVPSIAQSDSFDWFSSPDGDEFDLPSEASRRILATNGRYISYGALRRDSTPCNRRGASYYNCRAGAQANPYSRSCSQITRCRS